MAPLDAFGAFYAEGAASVDYAEDAAALVALGEDYLDWICCGAEECDYFRDILDAAEDVDRETLAQEDEEGVAGTDGEGVFGGCGFHRFVVSFNTDETVARGFAEGDAEFDGGVGVDDGLVEVLYRFNEMALAKDQVCAFGDRQLNALQFHSYILDPR